MYEENADIRSILNLSVVVCFLGVSQFIIYISGQALFLLLSRRWYWYYYLFFMLLLAHLLTM